MCIRLLSEDHDATAAEASDVWPYKSGLCLLCAGGKSTAKDKLYTVFDGLQTIRRNCEMKGNADLVAYRDAHPTDKHVVHNACRTRFNKARSGGTKIDITRS
jgi:hypothetical protein